MTDYLDAHAADQKAVLDARQPALMRPHGPDDFCRNCRDTGRESDGSYCYLCRGFGGNLLIWGRV